MEQDRAPPLQLHLHQLAGKPLTSYRVIVELIAATTTRSGLRVEADLDTGDYPIGQRVTDAQLAAINLTRHEWHGEWNYTIGPP